jgi:hypothetical protein
MDFLKLSLAILKAWNSLVALLRSWRDREAGKREVILDVKENSDDALKKADDARASQSGADTDDSKLRDTDGYRRD